MLHSKLHYAARAYAEAGWPVHRVTPGSKLPASKWKDEATTDLDIIDSWYEIADWNIGCHTGKVGICVVDVDKGGETELYSPCVVVTPHDGRHLYFAGSLPPSVSKLAPKVDTRGEDSYVLLPPSIVDGKRYEECWKEVPQAWDLPDIPDWVVEKLSKVAEPRNRSEAIKTDVTDRPQAIKLFKRYLDKNPIPPEGEGSDDATYRVVSRGRDLGLSSDTIGDMVAAVADSFDIGFIWEKIENAERYQQNEPGCDTPETGQEKFGRLALLASTADDGKENRISDQEDQSWIPHDPRDPADMPALEFYDPDKCIPKSPDGAVGIIYGKRGDHKTNTVLSMLALSSAQSILYAAGEGAYGVERDRLAARATITGRIKILPRVPLFSQPEQVLAFINGCNSINFRPEIVVIDTMATALAGDDENSNTTAGYLTDNGPCGLFKRAWNCTVILVAHSGKDATRGVRGASGFEGNVDFVLAVEANKKAGAIRVHVDKMRDGYDGFNTYWVYENDPNTVPVPERINEAEFMKLVATPPKDEKSPIGMPVMSWLRLNGHHDWNTGIERGDLAIAMTEIELGMKPDDIEELAAWETVYDKWVAALKNGQTKDWGKRCTDSQRLPGGTKSILRWFSAIPQDTEF